jgi:hypothetical protein
MRKEFWEMTREEYEQYHTITINFNNLEDMNKYIEEQHLDKSIYGTWFKDAFGVKWFVDIENNSISSLKDKKYYHKDIVKQAILDGKPVPDEALEHYPDLRQLRGHLINSCQNVLYENENKKGEWY